MTLTSAAFLQRRARNAPMVGRFLLVDHQSNVKTEEQYKTNSLLNDGTRGLYIVPRYLQHPESHETLM